MARATKAPIYSKIRIESRLIRTLSRRRPSAVGRRRRFSSSSEVIRSELMYELALACAVEPEEMRAEDVILGS